MKYDEKDLFVSGENGYNTYRIPAITVSQKGTILAFCEGRRNSVDDSGDIDIILRRSFDNGKNWENMRVILDDGKDTIGNPAPVVDRDTGIIWLLVTRNLADGPESLIIQGKAPRTVWVTYSEDDGETWAELKEITQDVKKTTWTWYATGPCHGIQLKNGRLIIPCDHVEGTNRDYSEFAHSHVIYSDDHGETWHIGGIAQKGTNECVAVETNNGAVYLNCRNYRGAKRRAFAWSYDGGITFTDFGYEEKLIEPICQGSMIRFDENYILFSNPASTKREKMTVRISNDECKSWNDGKILYEGPSAYSDLCVLNDMTIGCIFEKGKANCYETIIFANFDLEWLFA